MVSIGIVLDRDRERGRGMSHWNGYEIQDIFGGEDCGVNHLQPFQDGEQVLESDTFCDYHKKPRYETENDVIKSTYDEDPANEAALKRKVGLVLPFALKEGSSNILDPSWPLLSETAAPALGFTKCSTGSTILNCQGDIISTSSFRESENDRGNATLCSDYPFLGKRAVVHNQKLGDISSADDFVGVLTMEHWDGNDDQLFCECPNIGDFEDFNRKFRRNLGSAFAQGSLIAEDEISWFSSSSHGHHGVEDTLQSVVLSANSDLSVFNNASSSSGFFTNIYPAIEPSSISNEIPSGTGFNSFQQYSDAERKGKSVLSKPAYDHAGLADKSSTPEQFDYGNECRDLNMINMTIKELCTTNGKKITPTAGSTVQSPICGCAFIQNVKDQELSSSVLSTPQPCSLQMSDIVTPQHVSPVPTTVNSSVIGSTALPNYVTSKNQLSHAPQPMGQLPGPIFMPSMPIEENDKLYACHQFAAALVMDKHVKQHIAASDSSVRRRYKFEDEVDHKKPAHISLNLTEANMDSSFLQDNPCVTSSFLDDVSLKTACFQQLQMIVDQLGVRTKLCMRDSLYRLARSAEQSHYYGTANNVSSGSSSMRELQGAKDLKRPPEFLGTSTNTNAIERTLAYLLFHKSLEHGTGTADSIWFTPPIHHIHDPVAVGKFKEPYTNM